MKNLFLFSLILFLTLVTLCNRSGIHYPVTKKSDQVDIYFGVEIPDPYRWLEDDNSEETAQWVAAQNETSLGYLEKIPYRNKIRERLTKIWNYPRMSAPWKDGGYYFFTKNDGLQNQSVYYIMDSLNSKPRIILDPNTLSEDGTVALTVFSVSHDGKYAGYGISRGGSDWREFYIKDITAGKDLDDHINWVKFSGIAWFKDGFYYSRYPAPDKKDTLTGVNEHSKIYYHTIGTEQGKDRLIYEEPEFPKRGFYAQVTEDKRYLIITAMETTSGNALYFQDLAHNKSDIIKIVTSFKDDFIVIDHVNDKLLILTNHNAPRYKLIQIDVNNIQEKYWKDLLPERDDRVLTGVTIGKNRLIALYEKDAHSIVELFDPAGTFFSGLELPGIGSILGFNAKKEENTAFYTFTSFTNPGIVFHYDIQANKSEIYYKTNVDFDTEGYETKQVFFKSKDGTQVPMFITNKKGITLDGNNPTLLYGYGGFNISITPSFKPGRMIWLENGGIYASANLRGGGEYGEEWHLAGVKMKKQNVFDDFIHAAKYLIHEKYTSPPKLAIQGRSNGGLLIGAVVNQAPELFGVALPGVGVMDMLRYHTFTIGHYWAVDYGTSEESREMFEYLYGYSPVHNIKNNVDYPAVMVTTADHDDRVVPAHSFKYIAALQEKYTGKNPVLIRIETKSGHGGGKPVSRQIEEEADLWSFTFYNMGISPSY